MLKRHRPQDFDDLRALLADASDSELSTVREALALVEARGYNRGRNLGEDHAGDYRHGSLTPL